MQLKFLATGDSAGIPVFGCECRACGSVRRLSGCCASVESGGRMLLLDAGLTDLKFRYKPAELRTVLLTHYHADHVMGLMELRWGCNAEIQVIGPDDEDGFDDLFRNSGILDFSRKAKAFEKFVIDDFLLMPLPLNHSKKTLGYYIDVDGKSIAYLTDTCGLPVETLEFLCKYCPDVMVLDCTHPSAKRDCHNHNNPEMVMDIYAQVNPGKLYLTHISHEFECEVAAGKLMFPDNIHIARDYESVSL